jgi:HSP20 family protein
MSKYALLPYRRTNDMDRIFNDFDRDFFSPLPAFASGFSTDILDEGDHYLLEAELPGFQKEDISVDIEGDQLVIRASREQEQEDNKKNFLHRERSYGTYTRRFDIAGVETDKISAKYEDGVLKLLLPKEEKKAPEGKKIQIV